MIDLSSLAFGSEDGNDASRLREALDDLQQAEAEYRLMHDLHGDSSRAAGRAWLLLRRAGDAARTLLDEVPSL